MPTIFTRIIDGEIPGTFVWKDHECVAFMSINPLRSGHTLVVPRLEIDHWIDCPVDLRTHLFDVAQTIGQAIDKVYGAEKVGMMIAGLEVPHLHIHLVPMDGVNDLDFTNAADSVDRGELENAASAIRYILKNQGAVGASE
jgi:histidine triad (HIT) family protein